jgi:hypothetical protein
MASLQQLGDQIFHGGQDIARTERLQRICVARLVELSPSIAVVTHLSPFLYSDNRRQGAIPESGHTMLLTWVLLQTSKRVMFDSYHSLKYQDTMLDKRVNNRFLQQHPAERQARVKARDPVGPPRWLTETRACRPSRVSENHRFPRHTTTGTTHGKSGGANPGKMRAQLTNLVTVSWVCAMLDEHEWWYHRRGITRREPSVTV